MSTPDTPAPPAVPVSATDAAVPAAHDTEPAYAWLPAAPAEPRPLAGTALWLGIAALGVSLFVGWGFPLGVGALAVASAALRRAGERRGVVAWAIGLGTVSLVYSAGWLVWAVTRM